MKVWYTKFMKSKLSMLLLFMLLVSCAPVETPAPEIIYVVITATPEPTPAVSPEYYFNSWNNSDAQGMYFPLQNGHLIFAKSEQAALHEVGHIVYRPNPDFNVAVEEFLSKDQYEENLYALVAYYYEYGMIEEIFAELYMWNILYELPIEFEGFY